MSWMTPAGCAAPAPVGPSGPAGCGTGSAIGHPCTHARDLRSPILRRVGEELLDPMPPLLKPVKTQPKIDDEIANEVVQVLPGQVKQQSPVVEGDVMPMLCQVGGECLRTLLDLDGEYLTVLGEGGNGSVRQQPPTVD